MFLSGRNGADRPGGQALVGPVTLGGNPAGVYLEGERRGMDVYGPKGYSWTPEAGDQVLVLKAGGDGEQPCVVGIAPDGPKLKPGQVRISAGKAAVLLSPDGRIEVEGLFTVNGTVVGPPPPKEDDDDGEKKEEGGWL